MTVSLEEVRTSFKKAMAEKGESYIYPGSSNDWCTYTDTTADEPAPSCAVGFVIADLFPEVLPTIYEYEKAEAESIGARSLFIEQGREYPYINSNPVRGILADAISSDAIEYLAQLQGDQDAGLPWGAADAHAVRIARGDL